MTFDRKMREIFPKPPMVAFRQPPNLRNVLVHDKLKVKNATKSKRQPVGSNA